MFYSIVYKNEFGNIGSVLNEAENAEIAKANFIARGSAEFLAIYERSDFVPVEQSKENKKMSKEHKINLTSAEMVVVLKALSRAADEFQGYINEQEDALTQSIIIMNEEGDDENRKTKFVDGCELNFNRLNKEKKEYEEVGTKIEKVYYDQCEYRPYFTFIPRGSTKEDTE